MLLVGKFKDNNVAALQIPIRQYFFVPRTSATENEFVNQQVVADQQRTFHGSGGNLESLHDKRRAEQREDHRNQKRLQIFGESGLLAVLHRLRDWLLFLAFNCSVLDWRGLLLAFRW